MRGASHVELATESIRALLEDERVPASVAAAVVAVLNGAAIVRVHDVRETVDALKIAQAVIEADAGTGR